MQEESDSNSSSRYFVLDSREVNTISAQVQNLDYGSRQGKPKMSNPNAQTDETSVDSNRIAVSSSHPLPSLGEKVGRPKLSPRPAVGWGYDPENVPLVDGEIKAGYTIPGATEIASTMSFEEVKRCGDKYELYFADLFTPGPDDRACSPPKGQVALYKEQFNYGLRIPPCPLLLDLMRHHDISITQIAPNAIACIYAFSLACKYLDVEANVDTFHSCYLMKGLKGGPGWYYATARAYCGVVLNLSDHIVWKEKFFFMNRAEEIFANNNWNYKIALDNPKPDELTGLVPSDVIDKLRRIKIDSKGITGRLLGKEGFSPIKELRETGLFRDLKDIITPFDPAEAAAAKKNRRAPGSSSRKAALIQGVQIAPKKPSGGPPLLLSLKNQFRSLQQLLLLIL